MQNKLIEAAEAAADLALKNMGCYDLEGRPESRRKADAAVLAREITLAFLEAALEDQGVIVAGAEVIADALNMNRAGRLENEAARSFLRALIARAQS